MKMGKITLIIIILSVFNICLAGRVNASQLKDLMYVGGNNDYLDSNGGTDVNDMLLHNIANSPFNSFALSFNAEDIKTATATDLIKSITYDPDPEREGVMHKRIWPMIHLAKIIKGVQATPLSTSPSGYIMELNENGRNLQRFYNILIASLQAAKETNVNGLVIDPEPYAAVSGGTDPTQYDIDVLFNYYNGQNLVYNDTTPRQIDDIQDIKDRLKEIGKNIADKVHDKYPSDEVKLWFLFAFLTYPPKDYPGFNPGDYTSTNYIVEGLLEQIRIQKYSNIKVIEGGETIIWYYSSNREHLVQKIHDRPTRYVNLKRWYERYPNNFCSGAPIVLYLDRNMTFVSEATPITAITQSKISGIDEVGTSPDTLPDVLQLLFSTNEYVWVYANSRLKSTTGETGNLISPSQFYDAYDPNHTNTPSYNACLRNALTPRIDTIPDQTINEDETKDLTINVYCPLQQSLSIEGPSFASITNGDPAIIRFTPTYSDAGTYTVSITAKNIYEDMTTANFQLTVNNVNRSLSIDPIGNKTVNENELLTFQVSASDLDGNPLTYSTNNLPQGATFENQTFTWTPNYTQAGTYTTIFTVSNGVLSSSETIIITVNDDLVYNPSMEEGSGGVPTYWVNRTPLQGSWVTERAHTGNRSIKIYNDVIGGTGFWADRPFDLPTDTHTIVAGGFSYAENSSSHYLWFNVILSDAAGKLTGTGFAVYFDGNSHDWQKKSKRWSAPQGMKIIRVQPYCMQTSATGTAYFDDIYVYRVD